MNQKIQNKNKSDLEAKFLNAEELQKVKEVRKLLTEYEVKKEEINRKFKGGKIYSRLVEVFEMVKRYGKEGIVWSEAIELQISPEKAELNVFLTFSEKGIIINYPAKEGKKNEHTELNLENINDLIFKIYYLAKYFPLTARIFIDALFSERIEKALIELLGCFADNDLCNGSTTERIETMIEEFELVEKLTS